MQAVTDDKCPCLHSESLSDACANAPRGQGCPTANPGNHTATCTCSTGCSPCQTLPATLCLQIHPVAQHVQWVVSAGRCLDMQAFDGEGNELMLANYVHAGDSEPGPSTSSGGHQVLLDLAPDWKEKLGLQVAEVAQDLREEQRQLRRSQGRQVSGMGRAGLGWAAGGQGGGSGRVSLSSSHLMQ